MGNRDGMTGKSEREAEMQALRKQVAILKAKNTTLMVENASMRDLSKSKLRFKEGK